jgi:hypothetical protein
MAYSYPFRQTDERTKLLVWEKGSRIEKFDPAVWRRDACGHAIRFSDHGDTGSEYGWEIDHIRPVERGGQTVLNNLQPLYWVTNRSKGDQYPWSCAMST